jgi:Protein of unknown function (DUF3313)
MKIFSTFRAVFLLATTLVLTGALAASTKDLDALMGKDGLQKTKVKGIEFAYVRPGATLVAYKRVKLDPVEVSFDPTWNPDRTGSRIKLSSEEREKIRSDVARFVAEEFARELQAKGKYPVVNEAGPDVLRVKASVVNLYLNAPDSGFAGRSRTVVRSAGEMTLVAELSDSASGQVLARVADKREADDSRLQLSDSMLNEFEARNVAAAWARVLRKALDKAQGIGAK